MQTSNERIGEGTPSPLDLFSISQKICSYNAPILAFVTDGQGKLHQTCCNHWDCPRCGIMRAKQEYGRIVEGAKRLAEQHTLYFYTFTCRGRYLSLHKAERNYLLWTNRLLSTMRARCKKEGGAWVYVQVTERQKRGHPHSHLLMAWVPNDVRCLRDKEGKEYLASVWFSSAHRKSGLGTQSRITAVGSAEATSRYIAKYLFKDAMLTRMPDNWHRVRYSQSFPKVDAKELRENVEYITIKSDRDWQQIAKTGIRFSTTSKAIYDTAFRRVHCVDYSPLSLV